MAKDSSPSRAPKTGAQLLEEREKWLKKAENPLIPATTLLKALAMD